MSLLKSIKQQLGLGPAAENHFWDGSVANKLSLKRGTPDTPGAELIKADGNVLSFPQLGKSLGANADTASWFELPNGLIIQTGPVSAVSAGGGLQVNFPKVFPTACLSVVITSVISAGSTNVYSLCLDAALPAVSAFGVRNPWTGGALGGRYIAIGY